MSNTIKRIAAAVTVALPMVSGAVAPAASAFSGYAVGTEHNRLIDAIRSTGIQFILNDKRCEEKNAMGWYWAYKNEMVICQDNRNPGSSQVAWTSNDLDTLRHEAQHLVQDCMVGGRRDGRLGAVYQDPIGLAQNVLSRSYIRQILEAYADADDHTKVMELEAFSVAALNDPAEQVRDIQKFCF